MLEEEHKRMAEEEKRNDVTKKRDLTDFYRDILSQRTAEVASSVASSVAQEKSPLDASIAKEPLAELVPKQTDTTEKHVIKKVRSEKQRTYRSRRVTSNSDHARSQETGSEGDSESDEDGKTEGDVVSSKTAENSSPGKGTAHNASDEENIDKDDSDSSDSDSADDEKGNDQDDDKKEVEVQDGQPEVKKLLLSEAEQREERIRLVKESCKKRNTPETIQAAIERYWKRQAAIPT